jgi:hypothetical protein
MSITGSYALTGFIKICLACLQTRMVHCQNLAANIDYQEFVESLRQRPHSKLDSRTGKDAGTSVLGFPFPKVRLASDQPATA